MKKNNYFLYSLICMIFLISCGEKDITPSTDSINGQWTIASAEVIVDGKTYAVPQANYEDNLQDTEFDFGSNSKFILSDPYGDTYPGKWAYDATKKILSIVYDSDASEKEEFTVVSLTKTELIMKTPEYVLADLDENNLSYQEQSTLLTALFLLDGVVDTEKTDVKKVGISYKLEKL